MMKNENLKRWLLLYIGIFIYSLCLVANKLAGKYSFLSMGFCFFYGFGLLLLAAYAVLWQQVLKYLPLTTAYANRSLVMILTMLWGILLFNEQITVNMLIGAVIILLGVNLVVKADE